MRRKTLVIVVSIAISVIATGVYATGRIYTNKNLDDLKGYVDSVNLNIQLVDSEQRVLASQINEVSKQIAESKMQTALLQNQYDRLVYNSVQYTKKREQQQLIEKYQLQVEYYNVCLMMKQLSLAHSELEVVNKQISVEKVKVSDGTSTQLMVDDLKNQKQRLLDKISSLEQSIEYGKSVLKARLNETSDVLFDPEFIIPVSATGSEDYTLVELKKACENNNLNLQKAFAYISYQDTLISSIKSCIGESNPSHLTAVAEKSTYIAEATGIKQQIGLYVEKQYTLYKESSSNYITSQKRKALLNRQLDVLRIRYENGDISELQYLTEKLIILNELYNMEVATIGKLNSKALMNLVENGIMME